MRTITRIPYPIDVEKRDMGLRGTLPDVDARILRHRARSQCDGRMIVVCNYEPAGNYLGQKPY